VLRSLDPSLRADSDERVGRWSCPAALLVTMLWSGNAGASGADVFGIGSEAIARGGAMTAVSTGHEATFYNPAGLAFGERRELSFGYLRILPDLTIQTRSGEIEQEISDPDLLVLGVALPLSERFAIGFSSYVLPQTILHVVASSPEEPFFPYYANRTQRLLLLPAIAARPFDWLSVGVGVNYLAGLGGGASAAEGPTREVEANVSEELPPTAALHAGLRVQALESLAFGFVYRQAFSLPYFTDTTNVIAGTKLDVSVEAKAVETPDEFAVGVGWKQGPLALSLDGTWARWSESEGPYVRVTAFVAGVQIDQPPPSKPYRDVFNLRWGAAYEHELSTATKLTYRLGQFFEPSFIEDQPGRTNLIDGPKLGWSAGLGIATTDLLPLPLRFDLHAQAISVRSRRYDKRISTIDQAKTDPSALADEDSAPGVQISNRGYPSISGGGRVYTAGATVTLELLP
jgi:hypothetical protein